MKVLYVGTDPSHYRKTQQDFEEVVHYPLLEVIVLPEAEAALRSPGPWTHIIFTSKNAVTLFFQNVKNLHDDITLLAVGIVTAAALEAQGYFAHHVAEEESQEGLISLLGTLEIPKTAHFLLPRSARARPVLTAYLQERGILFTEVALYTVRLRTDLPPLDLATIEAIFFTSPSTVSAFVEKFGRLPSDKKLLAIGPVTLKALSQESLFR